MAQKIIFSFIGISGILSQTYNFKFGYSAIDYYSQDIIFTDIPLSSTQSNVVYSGANINEFANNFGNVLLNILPPISLTSPFYNKVTVNGNNVELIVGGIRNDDTLKVNNNIISDLNMVMLGTPTPFGNFLKTTSATNSILISWGGASDDIGITGYELQYRVSVSPFWQPTIPMFITTSLPGASLELPIRNNRRDYVYRIRTKDTSGQYSDWKLSSILNEQSYFRSIGTASSTSVCLLDTTIPIYLNGELSINSFNIVGYSDSDRSIRYNGNNNYRSISNNLGDKYSVIISDFGTISNVIKCNTLYQLLRTNSGYNRNTTICNAICDTSVYSNSQILDVGSILYNDSSGTIPFTYTSTTNKYYKIDNFMLCLVNKDTGVVITTEPINTICATNNSNSSGCCFLEGTEIRLSNDDCKNIENISIGDEVLSYDFNINKITKGIVTELFKIKHSNIIKIYLSDGSYIESTEPHPFWVKNKGWSSYDPLLTFINMNMNVSLLSINDELLNYKGIDVSIIDIKILNIDKVYTYDITVNLYNNYFANNVLVHNKIIPNTDPIINNGG